MKLLLRLVVGLVAAGLALSTALLPGSSIKVAFLGEDFSVSVDPLPLSVVCSGAMVEVAGQSGVEIGKIERVGTARIWHQSQDKIDVEERSAEAYSLRAAGNQQSTKLLSAIQTQVVNRARATGLLAGYCEQPVSSGWFVAGDGGVGRESVLVVANPNPVDSQLLLEFHFGGKVITERIVLAASTERLVSLATMVGVEPSYAIYFESSGAPLLVALQHRYSDGLTPLGVSLTTAIRSAQTSQWIAPLEILAEGYERPRLRIFASKNSAEVRVKAIGISNTSEITASVASGELAEFPLALTQGTYVLRIESSEPVLAQVLNPSLTPLDYSWLSPLVGFTELFLPLPNFASEIAILNPGKSAIAVEVSVKGGGGIERSTISLRPEELIMLPVSGDVIELKSSSEFMSALRILDSIGYAVINPTENANPGKSLQVTVR